MRQTSILAYRSVRDSGWIGKKQKEAYDKLYSHGPCTASELLDRSGIKGVWKRLSDLVALGLVSETGRRKCTITGREVLVYDVTSKLPPTERPQKPKRETRAELLKKIARLEIENANIRRTGQQILDQARRRAA